MTESVQSCAELSIHFSVFFSRELFLVAVHSWFAIQTNVWKVQNKPKTVIRPKLVGVKIFILQDPNLASGRELLDTPARFYLTRYLKHTNEQRPWRLLSD